MKTGLTTRHQRENIVTVTLAVLFGAAAFLFCWLVAGNWFLGMLAVVAVLTLLGLVHYLVWGRQAEEAVRGRGPGTSIAPERNTEKWPGGPSRFSSN